MMKFRENAFYIKVLKIYGKELSYINNLFTWERIMGPPCDANSLSFFIIWTIFWVNPCIAIFKPKNKRSIF